MTDYWKPSTWDQSLTGFCESKLSQQYSIEIEPVNTFSSLFIILWGIYGLYQLPSTASCSLCVPWQIIFSLIICIGIGSMGLHSTKHVGWSLMDSNPMILTEVIALFYIPILFLKMKQTDNKRNACICKVVCVLILLMGITTLSIRCVYGGVITYSEDVAHENVNIFPFLFGAPLILIGILFVCAAFHPSLLGNKRRQSDEWKLMFRHVFIGSAVAILAGVIWTLSEKVCDDVEWIKYFPLHGLWHCCLPYGFYNVIQGAIYIDFNFDRNHAFKLKIKTKHDGTNVFQRFWYTIVLALEFTKKMNQTTAI